MNARALLSLLLLQPALALAYAEPDEGPAAPELAIEHGKAATADASPVDQVTTDSPPMLILHGTGGSAMQFLTENFAGVLFGPGQLLDARSGRRESGGCGSRGGRG